MRAPSPVLDPVTTTRSRRGLVALLAAAGTSILGTRMTLLAVPWLVLVTTGSASRTGLVAFAETAPLVLTQGLGGPLLDRLGVRRVSVLSDLLAAVALTTLLAILSAGRLGLLATCLLVAVVGVARGAGDTARYVIVPQVTQAAGQPLERGAGLFDGVSRLAGMIGAPLAGVLITVWSTAAVLAVDVATFLVSAVLVGSLVPRRSMDDGAGRAARAGQTDRPSYVTSLRQGFSHLRTDRLLLGIGLMVLVTNFVDQAFSGVLAPVWAREVTGSPVALGLIGAAFGMGAVAGNAVMTWLAPRLPRRQVFAWCFLVCGAPRLLVMAAVPVLPPVLVVLAVSGFAAGALNPILGAVEYERVPEHLRARVLGAMGAMAWGGIPLGALAGGFGVDHLGLGTTLVTAGVLYLLVTLAPFAFPAWKGMDRRPAT